MASGRPTTSGDERPWLVELCLRLEGPVETPTWFSSSAVAPVPITGYLSPAPHQSLPTGVVELAAALLHGCYRSQRAMAWPPSQRAGQPDIRCWGLPCPAAGHPGPAGSTHEIHCSENPNRPATACELERFFSRSLFELRLSRLGTLDERTTRRRAFSTRQRCIRVATSNPDKI